MQIRLLLSITFLTLFFVSVFGQKLKYKDIYPLIVAKKYDVAIPQLKNYLLSEGSGSEANPNLQLGLWLYERAMKTEVDPVVADSAIFYLSKAKGLIDEKEVKKKKDYYQTFKRRDLRSGKFLIKVSDVHLDIEKKIQELETKKDSKDQ